KRDEGAEIVACEPRRLFDPVKGASPVELPESVSSRELHRRYEVVRLVDPLPPDARDRGWHRLVGDVKVEGSQDVQAVVTHEETKAASDWGVAVGELEATVALVVTETDVDDAAVTDLFRQPLDHVGHRLIRAADAQRRRSAIGTALPELLPREADS